MGQLKILGAQRVKALTEILEQQRLEARKKASDETPMIPRKEARRIILAEMDQEAYAAFIEAEQLIERANELHEILREFGIEVITNLRTGYYHNSGPRSDEFEKKTDALVNNGLSKKLAAIDREFADKKNALWLCETLEEAKAIVFGEETE